MRGIVGHEAPQKITTSPLYCTGTTGALPVAQSSSLIKVRRSVRVLASLPCPPLTQGTGAGEGWQCLPFEPHAITLTRV